jgi:hypothetical protein
MTCLHPRAHPTPFPGCTRSRAAPHRRGLLERIGPSGRSRAGPGRSRRRSAIQCFSRRPNDTASRCETPETLASFADVSGAHSRYSRGARETPTVIAGLNPAGAGRTDSGRADPGRAARRTSSYSRRARRKADVDRAVCSRERRPLVELCSGDDAVDVAAAPVLVVLSVVARLVLAEEPRPGDDDENIEAVTARLASSSHSRVSSQACSRPWCLRGDQDGEATRENATATSIDASISRGQVLHCDGQP